ncbi:styrene monooxygenase/indole monooxygenase family protein [Kribbella sp. NBC_00359]|uniref:styrene monooxygenase/indole monooxygenase family protein n=1 Tax=Kribbella sp. NBC_00359 TaxID=2975966 RepID=UPI002E1F7536
MTSVGIIGAGIAGLHLALMLQQRGVETQLYLEHGTDDMRKARLRPMVCRFGQTQRRERELGLDLDHLDGGQVLCAHVHAHVEPPLRFRGDLTHPGSVIDLRVYLPLLVEEYMNRGGRTTVGTVDDETLAKVSTVHDLAVVATGVSGLARRFPIDTSRSETGPQRLLFTGIFDGIADTDPVGQHVDLVPGCGEIFQISVSTFGGRSTGLLIEAIPGGPWEPFVRRDWTDDIDGCARAVRNLLTDYGSAIASRIEPATFGLRRPVDLLQGAVTPTVRQAWVQLDDDRIAVALGDAAILNDPITGQGGNLGSASAEAMTNLITTHTEFHREFGDRWQQQLTALSESVTEWARAALGQPEPHVIELLQNLATDQHLANSYLDYFDDPRSMWATIRSPAGTAAFVDSMRAARI